MQMTVNRYIAIVTAAAIALAVVLAGTDPHVASRDVSALVLLAGLAVIAEMLGFFLATGAKGSIAFIPYLAAVLVVPSWATVAVVALVKLGVEVIAQKSTSRVMFNAAQHAVATALAVMVYGALGGESLLGSTSASFADTSLASGVPAIGALAVSFLANSLLVSGAVALSSGRGVTDAWREIHLPSIGVDLLASPIVFIFAWVYARFGPIAAAALWVPILGIRQLNKINAELDRMNRELLQLMVKSIEARDPYTSGHSRRVEHFAVLIARAIGLPERETRRIGQAALLHDVGKIHEKYAPILLKEDRLTPSEWATIQQHPIDGAELVSTMTQLQDLVPAIRHHHERWDGGGYPDGLVGDQIPRMARIIALADTIDAMTSARPYRPALQPEEVRSEMIKCRGSQFDPDIVDRLLVDNAWQTIFAPARGRLTYGDLHLVATAK
jgi:putative nucleotidyltransferase with HDIG domain